MRVLVVGGVAAGTKTAAKLKRELGRDCEITVITKDQHISYAGCGLPYFIGDVVKKESDIIVNTPKAYSELTGVEVITGIEATSLDRAGKKVMAKVCETGEEKEYSYDKLVIATGARPVRPPFPGADLPGVYTLRNPVDAGAIRAALETGNVKRAVIVGGGAIGLEMAENLSDRGVKVSLIDMAPHILPGFDGDFADYVENLMGDNGIPVFLGDKVTSIEGDGKVEKLRTEKRAFKTDMVVLAIGVRPNTEWLRDSGLEMNANGTLKVDDYMRTNDESIFAAGDVVMTKNFITGEPTWMPMGSTANLQGRQCAKTISGSAKHGFRGVLGTVVLKLPGIRAGKTGFGEDAAKAAGIDYASVTVGCDDKAHFYPDHSVFTIRLVAEKATRKLIGVQVLGTGSIDKIVDIGVTAISLGATLDQIDDMDFAYSPPFSTPIHPFAVAAYALQTKLDGGLTGGTMAELGDAEGYVRLDVGKTPVMDNLPYVPVGSIEGPIEGVPTDSKVMLICAKGKNSYLAENRLQQYGYKDIYVVEGGTNFNRSLGGKTTD